MVRKIAMIKAATGFKSKPSCPGLTYLVEILAEISESHCRRELACLRSSCPPARAAKPCRSVQRLAPRPRHLRHPRCAAPGTRRRAPARHCHARDRKSTRLNSSHLGISYAVFCLKKKKKQIKITTLRIQ